MSKDFGRHVFTKENNAFEADKNKLTHLPTSYPKRLTSIIIVYLRNY